MAATMNFFLLLCLMATLISEVIPQRSPHIIVIQADDLGWNDVGFHGMSEVPTPNLDALAADGIIMSNYYVSPTSTPSKSSFLTGLYPSNTGTPKEFERASTWALPLDYRILPQALKERGYTTHLLGKWQMGFYRNIFTPPHRGFDSYFGFYGSSIDYFTHVGSEMYRTDRFSNRYGFNGNMTIFSGLDLWRNFDISRQYRGRYLTDILTREATNIIQRFDKSRPLFLLISQLGLSRGNSLQPLRAPYSYTQRFPYLPDGPRRHFAGTLAALDDSVGRIMSTLFTEGFLNNSVILFTTENGAPLTGHLANGGSNWPLRGSRGTPWEGGIRGTALVWSPHLKNTPRISHQLMHVADWMPTLYNVAGGNVSKLGSLDGMNMWDALRSGGENTSPRSEILIDLDKETETGVLRVGDFKFISGNYTLDEEASTWDLSAPRREGPMTGPIPRSRTAQVLRRFHSMRGDGLGRLTWIRMQVQCGERPENTVSCQPEISPCLYNIREDPCEFHNIAEQHSEMVSTMERRLEQYLNSSVHFSQIPLDVASNPRFHGLSWIPWRT